MYVPEKEIYLHFWIKKEKEMNLYFYKRVFFCEKI